MAGCMPQTKEQMMFETGGLSHEKWEQMGTECTYEAKKATASAKPGPVRAMDQEELYILCIEAKGVKYKGKVRVPVT